MSNYLRIPDDTTADELAGMLRGDAIPTDAPREHLHSALLQLCEIVERQETRIRRLSDRLEANPPQRRNP